MKRVSKFVKYIPIFLSCIFVTFGLYLKNEIYNASFEQLIYSLFKTSGANFGVFFDGLFYVMGRTVILFPILLLPVINFKKKVTINGNDGDKIVKKQILPITNIKVYNVILIILSMSYLFWEAGLFDYLGSAFKKTDLFDKYYVDSRDIDIHFPEEKQNLIYIFMESTETSNLSKENGGYFDESVMPNLENVALDNINFSNSELLGGAQEAYGVGWTVAAMIGQTSGIPLKIKLNDFKGDSVKFDKITNIGDILNDNGYVNRIMMGSDSYFGGRSVYFENHHYEISDYYTAIEVGNIDEDYHEWWGYEDAKLFSYAKDELEELSSSGKSFNLTILTADTHFTDGYQDKNCETKFDSDYANSFYCSDKMIYEFVQWVQEQDFGKNTTIVISGDHLTMQEKFYDDIGKSDYVRTVYNTFINSRIDTSNNKNRVFTTMDMYPTTLASLGVKVEGDRLGLGTNLFSDKDTVPEEIGLDKFNEELMKHSKYYSNKIR